MKSKCFCNSEGWKNLSLLVLRLAVGVTFVFAGWMKLQDTAATAGMFEMMGWPAPMFFTWLVGLVELVAGAAVVLGLWTKMGGFLLGVVMLVALLAVHVPAWGEQGFQGAQLALSLLGGSMALSAVGGGAWSLAKDCMCGAK